VIISVILYYSYISLI